VFICISFMIAMSFFALQDVWFVTWQGRMGNETQSQKEESITVYVMLVLGYALGIIFASFMCTFGAVAAQRTLHTSVFDRLMRAPISWWESTPSGRILSRFSGDLSLIDQMLSFIVDDVLHFTCQIIVLIVLVCIVVPYTAFVIVVAVPLYAFNVLAIDRTNREAKRMANMALGPVITNLNEQVQGRLVVETQDKQHFFRARSFKYVDDFNKFNYFSLTLISSTQLASSFLSSAIAAVAGGIILFNPGDYEPRYAGLAVVYSFLIPYFLGIFAILLSMFFQSLTSLQRFAEYRSNDVPQEALWYVGDEAKRDPKKNWPQTGKLKFDQVSLVYRPGLAPAVKNASFEIQDGEKIGVVGRTGAGKSSLAILLFRINEAATGTIYLDGVDIAKVGLQTLRQACAIIPQDPLLLAGTVRRNLDPFEKVKDDSLLRQSLRKVGLDENLLDTEVGTGTSGSGLSAGEKQLLSLARVLLRFGTIRLVLMDEPTANIDMVTDEKVQKCIQSEFHSKTILTIAHRLNTVIESKIMVMDAGNVVEFGPSDTLLKNPKSYLSTMVDAMGPSAAANLRLRAKAAAATTQTTDSTSASNTESVSMDV